MKANLKLEHKELVLGLALALMGFLFTMREWLLWTNGLNPLVGFLVYYVIMYAAIYVLSKLGLVIFGLKITTPMQTFGLVLITMAFFITVNWESAYIQYVTTGSATGMSNVYLQAEDGAVFWSWQQVLPEVGMEGWRLLTYVVSPFVLAVFGGLLADKKIAVS